MRKATRRKLSNLLLIAGAVLVLLGVGYEAAIYPWRIVLTKVGVSVSEELPPPKPLPSDLLANTDNTGDDVLSILPENPGLLAPRARTPLTKVAEIQIPKIGVSENVVEGVGQEMLYAVGHMRDTPLPGQKGNCVLAAHRDYVRMNPFRHLDKVVPGDKVYLWDDENVYTYEVFKNFVVDPDETWVTEAQEDESHLLTMITCTPVLTSTHRMIVWARLTGTASHSP